MGGALLQIGTPGTISPITMFRTVSYNFCFYPPTANNQLIPCGDSNRVAVHYQLPDWVLQYTWLKSGTFLVPVATCNEVTGKGVMLKLLFYP